MQNPGSPNFEPAVPLSSISADGQYQLREQRTRIDQEALNASVLEHGVLTPVLLQEGVQGNFVLIDGYGRFNAAFANNLETVPGFIFSQGLSVLDIVSMAIASRVGSAMASTMPIPKT